MIIKVYLFAALREHVPGTKSGEPIKMEVPEGVNGARLLQELHITTDEGQIFLVNGINRDYSEMLHNGDEVAIFPPIGGG